MTGRALLQLDDATVNGGGGLQYALGSHRAGDLQHARSPSPPFSKAMSPAAVEALEARADMPWVGLELAAGDAVAVSPADTLISTSRYGLPDAAVAVAGGSTTT